MVTDRERLISEISARVSTRTPTRTEQDLQMSLPQKLRNLPTSQLTSIIPGASRIPTQTERELNASLPEGIRELSVDDATAEINRQREAARPGSRITPTEEALNMSLPANLRTRPVSEVREIISQRQKQPERLFTPAPTEFKPSSGQFLNLTSSQGAELEKMLPKNTEFIRDDDGLIIGIFNKNKNEKFGLEGIEGFLDVGAKERRTNFEVMIDRYERSAKGSEKRLRDFSAKDLITEYIKLQASPDKLTREGSRRLNQIPKLFAKAYTDVIDLGTATVATTLYNTGVGGKELSKLLWNNRKNSDVVIGILSTLPPAIWEGIKGDLARVFSGDPLEIYKVASENAPFFAIGLLTSGIGGFIGKGTKRLGRALGRAGSPYIKFATRVIGKGVAAPGKVSKAVLRSQTIREAKALSKLLAFTANKNPQVKSFLNGLKKTGSKFEVQRSALIKDGRRSIRLLRRDINKAKKVLKAPIDKVSEFTDKAQLALIERRAKKRAIKRRKELNKKTGRILVSDVGEKYSAIKLNVDNIVKLTADKVAKRLYESQIKRGIKVDRSDIRKFARDLEEQFSEIVKSTKSYKFIEDGASAGRIVFSKDNRSILNKNIANIKKLLNDEKRLIGKNKALIKSSFNTPYRYVQGKIKLIKPKRKIFKNSPIKITNKKIKFPIQYSDSIKRILKTPTIDDAKFISKTNKIKQNILDGYKNAFESSETAAKSISNQLKRSGINLTELQYKRLRVGSLKYTIKKYENSALFRGLVRDLGSENYDKVLRNSLKRIPRSIVPLKSIKNFTKNMVDKFPIKIANKPPMTVIMLRKELKRSGKKLSEFKKIARSTKFSQGVGVMTPARIEKIVRRAYVNEAAQRAAKKSTQRLIGESSYNHLERIALNKKLIKPYFEDRLLDPGILRRLSKSNIEQLSPILRRRKIVSFLFDLTDKEGIANILRRMDDLLAKQTRRVRTKIQSKAPTLKEVKLQGTDIKTLNKQSAIKKSNKRVDDIFREIQIKRDIMLPDKQVRAIKKKIKRRYENAIAKNNLKKIGEIETLLKKLLRDARDQKKARLIKIKLDEVPNLVKKDPILKKQPKIKTLKDIEIDTPKGEYSTISKNGQVLIQRTEQSVKTVPRIKVKNKKAQLSNQKSGQKQLFDTKSKYKVVQITKQGINLKPLYGFLFAKGVTQKQAQKLIQRFDTLSANDQVLAQDTIQTTAQAQDSSQAQGQKFALGIKQTPKTRQITTLKTSKKKKVIRLRLPKKKEKVVTVKKQPGYAVEVKRKGKYVRIRRKPVSYKDAQDLFSYSTDKGLGRTAKIISLGDFEKLGKIPPKVKGYYAKNKKKFRPFRIKRGKKKILQATFIEKKKFVGDTRSEQKLLRKAKSMTPKKAKLIKKRALTSVSQRKKKLKLKRPVQRKQKTQRRKSSTKRKRKRPTAVRKASAGTRTVKKRRAKK